MQNLELQPDGHQSLWSGDRLLDNDLTLAAAGIDPDAALELKEGAVQRGVPRSGAHEAAASSDGAALTQHTLAFVAPSLQSSSDGAAQQTADASSSPAAHALSHPQPPQSLEQPLAPALAPPSPPFLMQKIDPATRHNIRRAPSLEADVLCVVAGRGVYEFERVEGEWAVVSPSERERLHATAESFVAHDASVELCCRVAADGKPLFERVNVEDMAAAVTAHRSLLALCASSSSWSSLSIVPALQALLDSDSPSAKAYACAAACSWCAAGVTAAKVLALPLIHGAARLLCDTSAPFLQLHASACACALALDLTLSHPDDAGSVLVELLASSFSGGDDGRTAAALDGLAASVTTLERRSALIKAGLMPLLLEQLKRRDSRAVFLSALSVCSRMCDRSNSSEANPHQKEIAASGVLPLVAAAFDGPPDADIQGAASQVLWYLTRHAQDELVAAGIPALKHKLLQHSADINVLKNVLTCIGNYFRSNNAHADVFVKLGTLPAIVALLAHESPDIQEKASASITAFTGVSDAVRNALCDVGAVGALAGVVSKGSGEARKQACGALWSVVCTCDPGSALFASSRERLMHDILSNDIELVTVHVSGLIEAFRCRDAPQFVLQPDVVTVIKSIASRMCAVIDANSRLFLQHLSLFMLQNLVIELPTDVFPRIAQFGQSRVGSSHIDCSLLLSNLSILECNAGNLVSHDLVLSYLLDNFKGVPASDSRWLDDRSDLRYSLTAFVNLSQWARCRPRLLAAGVGEVMADLLVEGFVMEPMVIIALAFLYGSNEFSVGRIDCGINTVLASRPAALLKLVDCLDTTLQNKAVTGFAYGAFQISTLLCALEQLALSDSNKTHLAVHRVVMLAHRALVMFTSGAARLVANGSVGGGGDDIRSAEAAVSILLQLSFTSDDVDVLEQSLFPPSLAVLSYLETFLQSTKTLTDESRGCARLLASRLTRPRAAASSQPVVASAAAGPGTRHVMFSYCWAQTSAPEHVRRLASMLKTAHGVETWIDTTGSALVGPMAGSTDEVMAAAVEASSHVVVCVSKDYKLSPNCRQEGSYARQQEKKGKLKIIYVMMQEQYTTVSSPECVDGWLAIMVADKLW
jgi:hypothetical protein